MKRSILRSRRLASAIALGLLVGCNPPAPPQPVPPAPPAPERETAGSSTLRESASPSGEANQNATNPVAETPRKPQEMPSESFGVAQSAPPKAQPARNARPAATPETPDLSGLSAEDAAKRGTELFEREGELDGSVPYYHAALKKEPKLREALAQLADVQRLRSVRATEAADPKTARELLDEAAAVARMLRDTYPELSGRERETVQQVLFIEAGFFARAGDPAAALQSLTESMDAGFEGYELVAVDPDFAAVRALPDYAGLAARPQAKAIAAAQAAAAEEMAAFTPVPLALPWPPLNGDAAKVERWKDRPTLVVFFSPDVRPSVLQLAELASAKELAETKDLAIVLVADLPDEPHRDAIRATVEKIPAEAVLAADPAAIEGIAANAPHVRTRPTTLVVDRTGQVRFKFEGWHAALKLAGAIRAMEAGR